METEAKMETKAETEMETKTETEAETETKTPLCEMETDTKMETKTETETPLLESKAETTEMVNGRSYITQLPLPQFIVIGDGSRKVIFGGSIYSVGFRVENMISPLAKIEVERAKSNPNYVHLRFCHSNRYWHQNPKGDAIFALATEPVEDLSNHMCTLFSFTRSSTTITGIPLFTPVHVQSGKYVRGHGSGYLDMSSLDNPGLFRITDWSTLVNLPPRVAFKGYNDKYLRAVIQVGLNYHKFESEDPNERECGYEVHNMNDGHVRIRSDGWGMFWRRSSNWILGDAGAWATANTDTLFWPVLLADNTIFLRNAGNDNFCTALTAEGRVDCLNAGSSTMTNPARLVVEELVLDRRIYNIRYRMEHARIFDESPYVAGNSSVTNLTDQEAAMSVEIEYTDEVSNSFSNSITVSAGMTNTFEGGIPFIFSAKIEVSLQGSYTREWGQTVTTRQTVKASGSVPVPPRSVALVNYVGTRGTCNVPFSYTQHDRSSTNGAATHTEKIDGIFEGVNNYNFQFVVQSTRSL